MWSMYNVHHGMRYYMVYARLGAENQSAMRLESQEKEQNAS